MSMKSMPEWVPAALLSTLPMLGACVADVADVAVPEEVGVLPNPAALAELEIDPTTVRCLRMSDEARFAVPPPLLGSEQDEAVAPPPAVCPDGFFPEYTAGLGVFAGDWPNPLEIGDQNADDIHGEMPDVPLIAGGDEGKSLPPERLSRVAPPAEASTTTPASIRTRTARADTVSLRS
jgi:hypothetical protein